ncbi:MAG: thiamine pyrophosphate-dependent enzyme, partial [Cyclobacteriaceae bacterium]
MLLQLRKGVISKWFSGIGQEAISVGATLALEEDEYILPVHRNLGVFLGRNIPLNRLFSQFMGKVNGFTNGRDRSFHFGSKEHHIVGMISHLAAQLPVADGIALSHVLKKEKKATLVFCGDGGTSEGDFHEALNVASVWKLPVIFVIENNGYGLSTPSDEQFAMKSFADKGIGYGIESYRIDGNNVLEVYDTISKVAKKIRKNPQPVLIDAVTFRIRGHEEASGVAYVPEKLINKWKKKDPVITFENYLLDQKIISKQEKKKLYNEIDKEISSALQEASDDVYPIASTEKELTDCYAKSMGLAITPTTTATSELRFIDAISQGIDQAMEIHDDLVIMGQDVAEYGGVFKITEGFVTKYGKERVRNTPICESVIVGTAIGLSVSGIKSIVEMQFADFVSCAFNQIVNNAAKLHYRWGANVNTVIRMPTGAGSSGGPYHSQSTEAWFMSVPGLKIVY